MIWLALAACVSQPPPVDELRDEGTARHDAVLAWVEADEATQVELRVVPDGGAPMTWRQDVPAEGLTVGRFGYEKGWRLEARVPGTEEVLGAADVDKRFGEGVAQLGPVSVSWQVGTELPALDAELDAHPGPPAAWLPPETEAAAPLVVGLSEDALEAGYPVTGRRLSTGARADRGMRAARGGPVGGSAIATVEGREVVGLAFRLGDCEAAKTQLVEQWGPPGDSDRMGVSWVGARHQASLQSMGKLCMLKVQRRRFGMRPPKAADVVPIAAVDEVAGPGDLLPPPAGAVPLVLGAAEDEIRAGWPLLRKDFDVGGVKGTLRFKEGVLTRMDLLWADPDCGARRAELEARFGPFSRETVHGGFTWQGESVTVQALPSPMNASECVLSWSRR